MEYLIITVALFAAFSLGQWLAYRRANSIDECAAIHVWREHYHGRNGEEYMRELEAVLHSNSALVHFLDNAHGEYTVCTSAGHEFTVFCNADDMGFDLHNRNTLPTFGSKT